MAIAMANSFLFSPNFTTISTTPSSKPHLSTFSCSCGLQGIPPLSATSASSTDFTPINVEYLEREFGGHGVSFAGVGESCVVKMGMENGSVATLMLPSGLITSYKPLMWHGTTLEVLHTLVSEGGDGGAVVKGGVSVELRCKREGGSQWSPSTWSLHDVRGSPEKSIQVELKCSNSQDKVDVKYIVTLQESFLSSELVLTNLRSSSVQLMGSFMSHLTVSTPDATYAVGLQGSNYGDKPPLMSNFSIIPPGYGKRKSSNSSQTAVWTELRGLLSKWGGEDEHEVEEWEDLEEQQEGDLEGEEDDNYAHLTEATCRIYTSAPRRLTFIDRGRRNSVIVERNGFEELYVFSPGSSYEWYGKYAFICIGPSALLKPLTLGPQSVWTGAQVLHNPNL